jgi:putative transposase
MIPRGMVLVRPRGERVDAPGALHHIMLRGIERRKIFRVNRYREDSLARLGIIVGMTGVGR